MSSYFIKGGNRLKGSLRVSGNKNSILACLPACLLTKKEIKLTNVPNIRDVVVMLELLDHLGVSSKFTEHEIVIQAGNIQTTDLPASLTSKLRASVLLAGALLAREGKVKFSHPGGDIIGKRSIDIHLTGFQDLGYKVEISDTYYKIDKANSKNKNVSIFLEVPSVTGTENLILTSVMRDGTVTLKNCATEPHVIDLCSLLSSMGAKIEGAGSSTLIITGVESLDGTEFMVGSDATEFGTYVAAAAITNGSIKLENVFGFDLDAIIWPFRKMGVSFKIEGTSISAQSEKLHAIPTLTTGFWPGFPTDLMSIMIVLATQATGVSLLRDWIYESRMFFVDKLVGMGAHITIADPHRVLVYGPTKLSGRELETPDIRAGMALVLAALTSNGVSTIHRAELIERGYENVVENLSKLGANIKKID